MESRFVRSFPDLTPLAMRRKGAVLQFSVRASEDILEQLPDNYEVVLAERLREVLADPTATSAEIDLENVAALTSRQLGSLIALGKVLRPRFGAAPVRGLSPTVRHLLEITRTNVLFNLD
jgi:anti-anti-sigma regulatory factor